MVKKLQKSASKKSAESSNPLTGAVKESAQQIWLAGLGAFSKAQQEGGKAFESLVKEGLTVQRKTQAVAEERISDATSRMSSMANDITAKASGQWDKLETIFEDRVARTLNKLGVPSAHDIDALIARIDELNRNVQKLQPSAAAPKTPSKSAAKAASVKTDVVADSEPAAKATPVAAKRAARKASASVTAVPAKRTARKAAAKPAVATEAPTAAENAAEA